MHEVAAFARRVKGLTQRALDHTFAGLSRSALFLLGKIDVEHAHKQSSAEQLMCHKHARQLRTLVRGASASAADAIAFRGAELAGALAALGLEPPWARQHAKSMPAAAASATLPYILWPDWRLTVQVLTHLHLLMPECMNIASDLVRHNVQTLYPTSQLGASTHVS